MDARAHGIWAQVMIWSFSNLGDLQNILTITGLNDPVISVRKTILAENLCFSLPGILLLCYGGGLDLPFVMDLDSFCSRTGNISFGDS